MGYKEILEGVVNIINTTEKSDIGFANICTYIGENCPELAESEGEKIRNFITNELACLRATDEKGSDRYEDLTNAIAWLEEQGIEKPKQYDIDILEKHITKDYISELAHTVIVRNGWEIIDAKEQKLTEWSEEDEKNLTQCIEAIDACYKWDSMIDWLKSLKERIGG